MIRRTRVLTSYERQGDFAQLRLERCPSTRLGTPLAWGKAIASSKRGDLPYFLFFKYVWNPPSQITSPNPNFQTLTSQFSTSRLSPSIFDHCRLHLSPPPPPPLSVATAASSSVYYRRPLLRLSKVYFWFFFFNSFILFILFHLFHFTPILSWIFTVTLFH